MVGIIDKEGAQEIFRQKVLAAMDEAAHEIFRERITRNDAGATDEDLPRLFCALDYHLDILAQRFNCVLLDNPPKHTGPDPREESKRIQELKESGRLPG